MLHVIAYCIMNYSDQLQMQEILKTKDCLLLPRARAKADDNVRVLNHNQWECYNASQMLPIQRYLTIIRENAEAQQNKELKKNTSLQNYLFQSLFTPGSIFHRHSLPFCHTVRGPLRTMWTLVLLCTIYCCHTIGLDHHLFSLPSSAC